MTFQSFHWYFVYSYASFIKIMILHGASSIISSIKSHPGLAPAWFSWLCIQLLVWLRSWSHSSWVWAPHQTLPTAWSLLGILSLSLSLCPSQVSLFLKKQNKTKQKTNKLKKKNYLGSSWQHFNINLRFTWSNLF